MQTYNLTISTKTNMVIKSLFYRSTSNHVPVCYTTPHLTMFLLLFAIPLHIWPCSCSCFFYQSISNHIPVPVCSTNLHLTIFLFLFVLPVYIWSCSCLLYHSTSDHVPPPVCLVNNKIAPSTYTCIEVVLYHADTDNFKMIVIP